MSTQIWLEVYAYNVSTSGWVVDAYPATLFPNNPVPGTPLPQNTAPTASVTTTGAAVEMTGLNAAVSYWLAVSDPNAGVVRWFPVPSAGVLGNSDTTPWIINIPTLPATPVSDALLEQAVGSLAIWSSDA